MADGVPPQGASGMDELPRSKPGPGLEPPPLTDIRVRGPTARGLNKPAILAGVGGGLAILLVLASSGFSGDPSHRPADAKPMMSDPARPEMAQGAIRDLPANYEQAAQAAAREPAEPPLLGPPLPGDIAAFAPDDPMGVRPAAGGWSEQSGYAASQPEDPAVVEVKAAERSGLFFALREQEKPRSDPPSQVSNPSPNPLTALGRRPDQLALAQAGDRSLFPGAVIPASLVTAINSESPGPVIAQITQTVYDSATGRTALIRQGARLLGDYKSSTRHGQSRIAILWTRIIMPDGQAIALDETAVDPSGAAGVEGEIDNHWDEVFGAAALGTLISIGVAATEDPQLTYGGIGVVTRDPVDAAVAEGLQRSAGIVTNRVVDRGLGIPPTIHVEAGKRVSVVVTRRMAL
jgi:type IV secretory pathway VirB10-like protein